MEKYPAWRDGAWLVLPRNAPVAPNRCILTNELVVEESKVSRRLTWGDEGSVKYLPQKIRMLLALANMKIFTVTFGLSDGAKNRRFFGLAGSLASIAVGFYLFRQGFKVDGAPIPIEIVGAGAALIVVSLVLFSNSYYTFDIVAVNSHYIWLRGAKPSFLDSLTPLESAQAATEPPGKSSQSGIHAP